MLVLTRKPGEKIHIGNDIILTVLEVQGSRIRVGIDAPDDVRVLRAELCPFAFAEAVAEPRAPEAVF